MICVPSSNCSKSISEVSPAEARQADIRPHGHFDDQSMLLAIFGDERQSSSNGVQRTTHFDRFACDSYGAGQRVVDSE